jgi:hypothetical protein
MTETLVLPPPVLTSPQLTAEIPTGVDERESTLRRLLDGPYETQNYGNYEYARDSGLIDMFYYDPATGQDGLVHVLSGNIVRDDEATTAEGYHHEPSGAFAPLTQPASYVDRSHIETLNAKGRAEFTRRPFEPYKAKALVAGIMKTSVQVNDKTGAKELVVAKSGMFPQEYDALGVMQAVRIALSNRTVTQGSKSPGIIVAEGTAPMIDGETPMNIRLVLDEKTDKVLSAWPLIKKAGAMKLEPSDVQRYVYGADGLKS